MLFYTVTVFLFILLSEYTNAQIKCGVNEIQDDCPSNCAAEYCPKGESTEVCARPNPCPKPSCRCQFNYRRAENGTCIPTTSCPPFACTRPNEHYVPCPPLCPTDDCSQATPSGTCASPFQILIVLECAPKCHCINNYWRKGGICVPYDQCNIHS
ncbi:uncharacterized protein ACR2FA_003019 [Aphomia sociella]